MTKFFRFVPLALLAAVCAAPVAHAQSVAATVNGVPISQARVDQIVAERVAQGQPDSPQLRQSVKDSLITQEVVAQEAIKQGVEKQPEVATRLELARQNVLIRSYLDDFFKKHPISDEAIKKEYEKLKTQMGDKEYKARHILVETEAEAKKLIADIKAGASFDKLAQEKSKDPGSGANGGDLGWSVPASYVKPFSDALTKLQKGQMTQQPVQTQFGWHVIKLDDTRPLTVPPLEDVKDNIKQQLQQQELQKLIAQLRTKAKVE
jgi:peptidyl-prolyl cis-trans isomerase C